jgi:DNA-binding HxlR family transcriptional regulator
MRKQRHEDYIECPIEGAMDIIGGKWKGSILFRLLERTRRFSELQRLLTKITQRTLTQQLRDLERDGLISRHVFAEVPPRVEYSLTERGRSLEAVLRQLKDWGEIHVLGERAAPKDAPPKRAPKPAAPGRTNAARSAKAPAARPAR